MQENYLAQTSCQVIETIKWIHDCVQDQTEPPDTILSSRFDSFFKHVLKSGHEDVKSNIKSLIEQILGERVVALEESMPHLQVLLGHTGPSESSDGGTSALKLRWKCLFSRLVYAIASKEHPIILVFEDLQ
jgi:predicted ATPase